MVQLGKFLKLLLLLASVVACVVVSSATGAAVTAFSCCFCCWLSCRVVVSSVAGASVTASVIASEDTVVSATASVVASVAARLFLLFLLQLLFLQLVVSNLDLNSLLIRAVALLNLLLQLFHLCSFLEELCILQPVTSSSSLTVVVRTVSRKIKSILLILFKLARTQVYSQSFCNCT